MVLLAEGWHLISGWCFHCTVSVRPLFGMILYPIVTVKTLDKNLLRKFEGTLGFLSLIWTVFGQFGRGFPGVLIEWFLNRTSLDGDSLFWGYHRLRGPHKRKIGTPEAEALVYKRLECSVDLNFIC